MSKNCIVSFANSSRYYIKGLDRLNESLRNNFTDGDFLGFINEATIGAPNHEVLPYGFKVYAIQKAIDAGYQNILWLDSSVFAIKNVKPIFDDIENMGFIFQDAGHLLGNWANDFTLNYFDITRDAAMEMKMIGNAGFLGLNMNNDIGKEIFKRWKQSMEAGTFKGKWKNEDNSESHDNRCLGARHDMSSSSAIVHQMGLAMHMKSGEEILQYAGLYDEVLNDKIILKAQGI